MTGGVTRGPSEPRSALYIGHLVHARRDEHARRAFRYPIYVASLDLDELPALAARLRLFSHNRPNLFALHDRDYRDAATAGLAAANRARLDAAQIAAPATTRLVTQLRVAHYVFNPASFFLDYDARGALASATAEVNNNYGGNHPYVLGPRDAVAPARYRVAKQFFVSPFIHGDATYDFRFDAPIDGDRLAIAMRVARPDGATFFVARLTGRRVPLTDRALAMAAVRYPLMTLQVIGLIYWEALKMHLAGVPFRRPGPDHRPTHLTPAEADPLAALARTGRAAR